MKKYFRNIILFNILFLVISFNGNAQVNHLNHPSYPINLNESSMLSPSTPLEIAFLIFMLIIGLAFGIARLKNEPDPAVK